MNQPQDQRTAIVSGASIAGLSSAYWLRRTGWRVIVLERAQTFRDGGQNVDVRGVAREVLERMGLVEAIRARNTTETGTVLVDESGAVTAELPSDQPDGATAELEVLRGDFARTILDALPDGVDIRYGDPIADVNDDTGAGGVVSVTTAAGEVLDADLLVIAEGVRSSTRDRLFGGQVDRRELGVTMAFGTIARTATDDDQWRWLTTTGGRQVHLRPDPYGTTRAILAVADAGNLVDLDRDAQLTRLRELFADAGWEAPRILDGFAGSEDIYIDDLTQIRMPTWHAGRVVLTGDSAWCVTPMGGGGASLALVGGYALAAHLSTAATVSAAVEGYESWMRPLVDDVQHLPRGIKHFAYPQSRLALALRRLLDTALTSAPLRPLTAKLTEVAQTDQDLPAMDGLIPAGDGIGR